MTNNNHPEHPRTGSVLDQNHGIEHIRGGSEKAYYPWFRNAEHKALYYISASLHAYSRARFTSYEEAYNFLAFQRGLTQHLLPYPVTQGKELDCGQE